MRRSRGRPQECQGAVRLAVPYPARRRRAGRAAPGGTRIGSEAAHRSVAEPARRPIPLIVDSRARVRLGLASPSNSGALPQEMNMMISNNGPSKTGNPSGPAGQQPAAQRPTRTVDALPAWTRCCRLSIDEIQHFKDVHPSCGLCCGRAGVFTVEEAWRHATVRALVRDVSCPPQPEMVSEPAESGQACHGRATAVGKPSSGAGRLAHGDGL